LGDRAGSGLLLQSLETLMGYDGSVTRPGKRPSCGYTPLQRIKEKRRIALLVRRTRGVHEHHQKMSSARFGIPTVQPATQPKPCSSSHAVVPTPRYNPTGPAGPLVLAHSPDDRPSNAPKESCRACRQSHHEPSEKNPWLLQGRTLERWTSQQLSWSSSSLRRISSSESTSPRFASPGTFRPQGFSPSRRLPPRSNARPCFMPETPMGFCSSRGFPHNQVLPTRRRRMTLLAFLLASSTVKSRSAWRLAHTSFSARSPNHWSPSGRCSDCESVPWEDCYIQSPTADPFLSFLPLQSITHSKWPRHAQRVHSCALPVQPPFTHQASLANKG